MLGFIFESELDDLPRSFEPPAWVSIVTVLALTLTLLLAIFIYLGIWIAGVATLASAIATGLWLRFGYAALISRRALPGHILLIVAQLVHGLDLLGGDYADFVVAAFPGLIQPSNIITDTSIALSLSLSASVVWLIGGAFAFYHVRAGGFVVVLLAVWSIVWPASHMLIPVLSTTAQGWIPGMITGLFVMGLAVLCLHNTLTPTPRRTLPCH